MLLAAFRRMFSRNSIAQLSSVPLNTVSQKGTAISMNANTQCQRQRLNGSRLFKRQGARHHRLVNANALMRKLLSTISVRMQRTLIDTVKQRSSLNRLLQTSMLFMISSSQMEPSVSTHLLHALPSEKCIKMQATILTNTEIDSFIIKVKALMMIVESSSDNSYLKQRKLQLQYFP